MLSMRDFGGGIDLKVQVNNVEKCLARQQRYESQCPAAGTQIRIDLFLNDKENVVYLPIAVCRSRFWPI